MTRLERFLIEAHDILAYAQSEHFSPVIGTAHAKVAQALRHVQIFQRYDEKSEEQLHAPAGFVLTGEFRCPKKGEDYLACGKWGATYWAVAKEDHTLPKLILRELPKKQKGTKVIVETVKEGK